MSKLPKKNTGQTLIGILIGLAIFSILAHSIFTLASSSFRLVSFNRARITARHLAQEKIEFIRNLPFNNVGTKGGIPDGPLPQEETVRRNKLNFTVKTAVIYVDDPFDGQTPNDLLPTDYKRVRVEVSWDGVVASRKNPVVFITDVAPKGTETTAGGGTLSIVVFDANGNAVPQADVHIFQNSVTPNVDLNLKTGDNGRIILPGAPVCVSCYQLTATKSGYSSERTYSTSEIANPNKPYATIIEGQLTEISFAIDKVSTLLISTTADRDLEFTALPSVAFTLRGEKTIGTDSNSQPVYEYNESLTTDGGGNLTINNVEWDNYYLTLNPATSYSISGTNPFLPIVVTPDSNINFKLALSAYSTPNLLLQFTDSTQSQIASVTATLSDGASLNESKVTGSSSDPDFGQVFFSGISNQTYTLTATASGYVDYSGTVTVSGQSKENVILTPN